jgi:hypothetical protein
MDVYVDESGDLGFSSKSTNFFIIAFLTCNSSFNVRKEMSRLLKKLHKKGFYPSYLRELKFSKMNAHCRTATLEKIALSDAYLGVIVVKKDAVLERLRDDPSILYNYLLVHNIISTLLPSLANHQNIHLILDKSLSQKRIVSFNEYVKNKASYLSYINGSSFDCDCISVEHKDSQDEPCLQAVDSIAGAYFQAYERKENVYVNIIREKISNFMLWPEKMRTLS